MRTRATLSVAMIAIAIAIVGVWLWRSTRTLPRPVHPTSAPAGAAPAATSERPAGHAPAPAVPAIAPSTEAPAEIKKIEIARTVVQRDDGSVTGGGAPTFSRETLRAIREAATPAVQRCIADGFARYPALGEQKDVTPFVSVVFTATARGGTVTVPEARAVMHGFPDDDLTRCAETAYKQLRVGAPGQADGRGLVESGYEVRRAHSGAGGGSDSSR